MKNWLSWLGPFLLALSIFGGASEAWAADPTGTPFCYKPLGSNQELQQKITASLAADPSGNKALAGCAANPRLFLAAFKAIDSGANLNSVTDLSAYVGSFVSAKMTKDAQYKSSCLWRNQSNAFFVKLACVERDPRPNEVVYMNPVTKRMVMMSSCANPGVIEVPPIVVTRQRCVEYRFPGRARGAIRFAYIGQRPLPGYCSELQISGESERRRSMPEECPDTFQKWIGGRMMTVVCSWDTVEEEVSQLFGKRMEVQNVSGSFYARDNGTNVLYLPWESQEGEVVICYEDPSITHGMRKESFVGNVATLSDVTVFGGSR